MKVKILLMSLLALFCTLPAFSDVYTKVNGLYYLCDPQYRLASVIGSLDPDYKYSGDITIPSHITVKINDDNIQFTVKYISNAFADCTGVTSVKIPSTVTTIDNYSFCNTSITTITIPSSVKYLGGAAFQGCTKLESITLPPSITSIESSTFKDCTSLKSIDIPTAVTKIDSRAFENCSSLTSIFIHAGITAISDAAFYGCTGLTSMIVEDGNPNYDSRNGCNAIIKTSSNNLLYGCNTTIIPNSIEYINQDAFYGCTGLKTVSLSDKIWYIGENAFYNCIGLTTVDIPGCNLCEGAFRGCSGLTSVTIPSGVPSIQSNTFRDCNGLTIVTILERYGGTAIGYYAFGNCSNLKDVYQFNKIAYQANDDAFSGSAANATLHVPASAIEEYKKHSPWNTFKVIVALTDEELTAIKNIENEQSGKNYETNAIYDLQGHRLSNEKIKMNNEKLPKGIYIVNGKKVVVK